MGDRRNGMRAIGAALPALTRRALGRRGFAEGGLALDWPAIVGADVAANCLPLKIVYPRGARVGGTLHLKVSSGYATVLAHCAPQVIERVNAYLGHGAVLRLRLVQGRIPTRPAHPESRDDSGPPEPIGDVDDPDLAAALGGLARALRGLR